MREASFKDIQLNSETLKQIIHTLFIKLKVNFKKDLKKKKWKRRAILIKN